MIIEFAPFHLNTDRAELRTGDGPIAMEPKAFALLCLLVENPDRVISKDEMIAAVWGGRFISDAAVSTALKLVRKALGDDGEAQAFVKTVRGRGHRFVAPVRIVSAVQGLVAAVPDTVAAPDAVVGTDARGERPTLAVLPFTQTGLPGGFTTLGDAIPAEIISSLARLRWLRVIARESSFRFRGDGVDLGTIRSVLGAGFCLSGRVEVLGKRLSVSVDLVDTGTGALIWSDQMEGPLDAVHSMRADIVAAVISALDLRIPVAEAARARSKPIEALDAWEAFHLGMSHVYRFNAHNNALAAALFQRATDLDPGFASAYAARSFASFQDVIMGYKPDRAAAVAQARAEAERSVELDPLDPYANMAMGRLGILTGRPQDGIGWLNQSVELSPSYAKGHYSRGFAQVLSGNSAEARTAIDISMRLSPLDPMLAPMRIMRALSFGLEGDYRTAADLAVQSAQISHGHFVGTMNTVALCQLAGQPDQAAHWARMVRESKPDASIRLFSLAFPHENGQFRTILCNALRKAGFPD
jgi:DNA-binding winged helix-turn-helix (wHTH) protein/tetratricopeptide (TPR) repeat protein